MARPPPSPPPLTPPSLPQLNSQPFSSTCSNTSLQTGPCSVSDPSFPCLSLNGSSVSETSFSSLTHGKEVLKDCNPIPLPFHSHKQNPHLLPQHSQVLFNRDIQMFDAWKRDGLACQELLNFKMKESDFHQRSYHEFLKWSDSLSLSLSSSATSMKRRSTTATSGQGRSIGSIQSIDLPAPTLTHLKSVGLEKGKRGSLGRLQIRL